MQRTLAADIAKHIGEDVKLVGWLFQVRELGSISFVVVRDRTGTAQAVILDPSKVELRSALARGRVMQLETVPDIAARADAIAAVNAGFFNVKNGDPAGVLELGDELVSDSPLTRGAVGILRAPGRPMSLVFDRLSTSLSLAYTAGGEAYTQEIDGVDTTRVRGKLMLYTPRFGPDSDMADTGVEWQLAGSPLRVTERRPNAGRTRIPRDGIVLSFGGTVLPTGLERLDEGQDVAIQTTFRTLLGTRPDQWSEAQDIVSGAGLLVHQGKPLAGWSPEQLRAGFDTERHPRTMIGTTRGPAVWLVTVDGRNPSLSLGMTFAELTNLALKLNLVHALNLDGGGSSTIMAAIGTDGVISPTEVTPEFVAACRKNTQERKARGIAAPYETEDGYLLRVFGETWG